MRLTQYLNERTEPTVKYTIEALKIAFSKIQQIMKQVDLFDIDDKTALTLLRKGFDEIHVKLEMEPGRATRKYISSGEFGGEYGKDYLWKITLQKGFSKVFRKFARERSMKDFLNPNKNPLFREFVEIVSHEILHSRQALNSAGAAFDAELRGIDTTYSGNMKDYLADPLEIEAYAQQSAIDTIRKGNTKSMYFEAYNDYFKKEMPKVWKKFMKKYAYYLKILKTQGDIKPFKK